MTGSLILEGSVIRSLIKSAVCSATVQQAADKSHRVCIIFFTIHFKTF